jgi:hypothetical protein
MRNHASSPIISNCLFANSWARDNGGAIFNYDRSSPQLTNCTFVGNSANANDGDSLYSLLRCSPTAYSCIFWDGFGDTEIECNQAEIFVFYSDIKGGYSGQTNINADPLFVDPCNPDLSIRNYRLQATSPCINTGDPNYIAEVNDTDLGGQHRIIGRRIDMGAYEFSNQIPVANAGDNRIIYAYINNVAKVNLDGSRSYSPQGKPLTYRWSWATDRNSYKANGVNPTIELPVGIHTIELIVNDGLKNSLPDSVDINVVAPVKAALNITPQAINHASKSSWIKAYMILPAGYKAKDVDANVPLVAEPAGTQSKSMNISVNERGLVCITGLFDSSELCANTKGARQELSVVGKYKTGQYFYGSDIIKVTGKKK